MTNELYITQQIKLTLELLVEFQKNGSKNGPDEQQELQLRSENLLESLEMRGDDVNGSIIEIGIALVEFLQIGEYVIELY